MGVRASRASLGEHAPRIETMKIPTDKIREVIGTGGKVIREIVEKTGAKVNVEDDGTIKVASSSGADIEAMPPFFVGDSPRHSKRDRMLSWSIVPSPMSWSA